MKKRLLAFLCVLAILAGMFVMPASAADTGENDTYQVGYAKRDINPWIELTIDAEGTKIGIPANRGLDADGNPIPYTDADTNIIMTKIHDPLDHSKVIEVPLVSLPMGGYGNSDERHVTCLTDDNGDGFITYGDGVYFTCTSVTDSYGKTVMYMTVDTTSIGSGTVDLIRKGIVQRLSRQVISKNEIVINANHSHSSMSFTKGTEGSAYEAYYYYMIERAVDAACEAYATRSQATMSKGSIESSAAMKKMGYVNEDGSGLVMNVVRHRYTLGNFQKSTYNTTTGKWSSWQQFHKDMEDRIELIRTPHSGGTCFPTPEGLNTKYKSYVDYSGKGSVSPVDETMHVLRFDRAEGNPVVMVNWRGHSTRNGGGGKNKNLSGDYANNLRYRLENNKTLFGGDTDYCVAFWQGASGNVNTGGHGNLWYNTLNENNTIAPMDTQDEVKVKWAELGEDADGNATVTVSDDTFYHEYYNNGGVTAYDNRFYYCAKYGYLLGKIALDCMANNMQQCDTGRILSKQVFAQWNRQQYTYGQYLAAKQWEAKGKPDGNTVFPYWYDADLDGNGIKERYILNSDFHANSVLSRYEYCDPDLDGKDLIPVDEQSKASMELDAITMGSNVAIVTIPGEPFDRYSSEATLETAALYNDWDKLIDEDYGTPFVMGYSNDGTGYLPNTLAYDYLSEKRVPLTSRWDDFNKDSYYKNYYNVYDPGSYESNTSRFERGTGEKVIEKLRAMLDTLQEPPRTAYCEACKQEVEWEGLGKDTMIMDLSHGHYYLEEDLATQGNDYQKHVGAEGDSDPVTVCLDLNGKHYSHFGRIFIVEKNGTLNVMDSQSGGTITAKPGSYNVGGGMMSLSGTLNMYSGKLEFVNDQSYLTRYGRLNRQVASGGVISGSGTVNMYGGVIQGDQLGIAYHDGQDPAMGLEKIYNSGFGGTIYLSGSGKVNAYGGQILSGKAAKNTEGLQMWYDTGAVDAEGNPIKELRLIPDGAGDCIYVGGTNASVNLYNDAEIDDIYFNNKGSKNKLSVYGDFDGRAAVQYNLANVTLGDSNTIGDALDGADISNAMLTYSGEGNYRFVVDGGKLKMLTDTSAALIGNKGYESLADAIKEYTPEDGAIKLLYDINSSVTVNKPVAIDLNGCDIEELVTTGDGVVYGLDSRTDDYQIEGDAVSGYTGYGKIKHTAKAKMVGVRLEDGIVADNYLMVTEDDGVSFHRVTLQISSMVLRAKNEDEEAYNPSLYYKSNFAGDALVAKNVKRFGIALSTEEEPNADNMGLTNKYSQFDGSMFQAGQNNGDTTSTLLYGIMKETNARLTNQVNAKIMVYGRPYVQTTEGEYLFGFTAPRTLKEQVELADAGWSKYSTDQKASMVQMYQIYEEVMADWNIPTIKKNAKVS